MLLVTKKRYNKLLQAYENTLSNLDAVITERDSLQNRLDATCKSLESTLKDAKKIQSELNLSISRIDELAGDNNRMSEFYNLVRDKVSKFKPLTFTDIVGLLQNPNIQLVLFDRTKNKK